MSSYTLKLHTKVHTFVRGRPTLKDVGRFRNESNLMRDHEQSIMNYAISNELQQQQQQQTLFVPRIYIWF